MTIDRPIKRSLTLQGHRTSVSLEEPFWIEFRRLAEAQDLSVNALASQLDAKRAPPASLASMIRLYVLSEVKAGR
jgi:predicted DNA-binding ribbon-helix-helix protein